VLLYPLAAAVAVGSPLTLGTFPDRVTFLYTGSWASSPYRIRMDVGATINPIAMPLGIIHKNRV